MRGGQGRSTGRGTDWARGGASLVAGALPVLAFPAPALWWCAPVLLVPWMLLLRTARTGRRAAWEGWLGGTGLMLALHHWLVPNLHVFLPVAAALLGLLWLPWGVLVRHLLHGPDPGRARRTFSGPRYPARALAALSEPPEHTQHEGGPPPCDRTHQAPGADPQGSAGHGPGAGRVAAAVVLVPSGWVLAELVRSWEYLGGPWGLLGASQWQVPPALQLASLGGVWLVGFVLVAVNTAVVALVALPVRPRLCGLLALGVLAGGVGAAWWWAPRPEPAGQARIAVVQPGVSSSPRERFARGEALTGELAGRGVDLVVWGESSVGHHLPDRPDLRRRLTALALTLDTDVLVNVDARRPERDGVQKSSVLVGPEGPVAGGRYDKMRLVPFGEYVPLRPVLGWATDVGEAARTDRLRGGRQVLLDAGGLRVGPLICFETAFPDMSRRLVASGAQVLVAQSATSTFQDSWAPEQHASLAALRAAETWRPAVHAALTGVSAVYGPDGEPAGPALGTDTRAARIYTVPLAAGTSPYVRFGDWVPWGAAAALLAAGAFGAARALTRTVSAGG